MAATTTSSVADSVKPVYDKQYLLATTGEEYFDQLAWPKKAMTGNSRGSSADFPIYEALDVATGTLTESSDVTPVAMADTNVSISVAEYGNAVQRTELLAATAFTEIGAAATDLVGMNRKRSIDIVVRDVTVGGTAVMRVNGRATRATLTSTDTLSWEFLMQAKSRALGWNIPTTKQGEFLACVHPVVIAELAQLAMWQNVSTYSNEMEIYDGEVGKLAGIRFMQSYNGKIYYSCGATAQAATTLSAGPAAGATTVSVTSATGLAVGDYITIGTLDAATAEQVQITAVNGTDLTISGIGNAQGNFGLRYAHSNGAAVTEAEQVVGFALQGPKSIGKAWSPTTSERGDLRITGPFDVLGRFVNYGWYMIAGWARVSEHWLIRLEATSNSRYKHIGANQY